MKVDNYEESGGESEKEKEEGESEEEKEENKKKEVEEDKEENKKEKEEEKEEEEYNEEVQLSQQVSFFGHVVTTRPFFTFFTLWSHRCDAAIFHIFQFSDTSLRHSRF